MIADYQTNKVFYADSTRYEYQKEIRLFKDTIEKYGYECIELKDAEDYYCRDYMPVQISDDDFVQFVFRPQRYIKSNESEFIANPIKVEISNNLLQPRYSRILLDGGNIIKWDDKVIITDRVLEDNRHQFNSETVLLKELESDLKCKVIIIPAYPEEETGHADGLVRFVDSDTVFINETDSEPEKEWLYKFMQVLSHYNLSPIELPCPVKANQKTANGLYINYLQIGNLVLVPQFEMKQDQKALEIIKDAFKDIAIVEPINAGWIAENGGVLNCATWTIH